MSTIQTAAPVAPFQGTNTCTCLQKVLRDKRAAHRFYLDAAHVLQADNQQVIAHAFLFTAAQEAEHAAVLQGLLTHLGGAVPPLPGAAAPLPGDPLTLLRSAAVQEHAAWDEHAPQYARIALEEGYPRIAAALTRMAETDQQHAKRFAQYLEAMADGCLFRDHRRISWVCLACGQFHSGYEPPQRCPGCSGGPGQYIRSDFYPFNVEG